MIHTYEATERLARLAINVWNPERLDRKGNWDPEFCMKHLEMLRDKLSHEPSLDHLASHYVNFDNDNIEKYQRVKLVKVEGKPRIVSWGAGPMVGDWFAVHKGIENMLGGISYQTFPYIPYMSTRIVRDGKFISFTWFAKDLVLEEDDELKPEDTFTMVVEIMD